jgi:DNA-directed RNA polymerase subunit M/transcription elongation factor TFIIS
MSIVPITITATSKRATNKTKNTSKNTSKTTSEKTNKVGDPTGLSAIDQTENKTNKNSILNISVRDFNAYTECAKYFNFKTMGANSIRLDVMYYVLENMNRKEGIFMLEKYVPINIADEIEKGILEDVMIKISNEKADAINFINNMYITKVKDICANLNVSDTRVNNKTLRPALLDGSIKPHCVTFMTPQQIHPARWATELEKISVIETANNYKKVTSIYKCRKCGDRNCTTIQKQTRASDEPMTIFVTCETCFITWTTT